MAQKSKNQKKSSGKPVKARDAKPAWLEKKSQGAPDTRSEWDSRGISREEWMDRIEPYPQITPPEKRYRRAFDATVWLQLMGAARDLRREVNNFMNSIEGVRYWKEASSEMLVRAAEREVIIAVQEQKWHRSEIAPGLLVLSAPELNQEHLEELLEDAPIQVWEMEAQTPLSHDLRALDLPPHSEETLQMIGPFLPKLRAAKLRIGWRGPWPKKLELSPAAASES
jgi:hypothetical protein